MIDIQTFYSFYPYLSACFAQSDPNSPTYTRRTKTGKMSIVRKGKRKKGINAGVAAGAVLGSGLAGTYLGYKTGKELFKGTPALNKIGSKTYAGVAARGAGIGAVAALGAGAGLITGASILNKIRKKRNKQ